MSYLIGSSLARICEGAFILFLKRNQETDHCKELNRLTMPSFHLQDMQISQTKLNF